MSSLNSTCYLSCPSSAVYLWCRSESHLVFLVFPSLIWFSNQQVSRVWMERAVNDTYIENMNISVAPKWHRNSQTTSQTYNIQNHFIRNFSWIYKWKQSPCASLLLACGSNGVSAISTFTICCLVSPPRASARRTRRWSECPFKFISLFLCVTELPLLSKNY